MLGGKKWLKGDEKTEENAYVSLIGKKYAYFFPIWLIYEIAKKMETIASNPCLDYILVNFNHNNLIIASNISLEYIILVNFHLYFKTMFSKPLFRIHLS